MKPNTHLYHIPNEANPSRNFRNSYNWTQNTAKKNKPRNANPITKKTQPLRDSKNPNNRIHPSCPERGGFHESYPLKDTEISNSIHSKHNGMKGGGKNEKGRIFSNIFLSSIQILEKGDESKKP